MAKAVVILCIYLRFHVDMYGEKMNYTKIENQVRKTMENGAVHHLYDNETRAYSLLSMQPQELKKMLTQDTFTKSLEMYEDLLGPNQIRSIKNGLISYVTLVSRTAIRAGVEAEFSYALSDYYINYMETLSEKEELLQLLMDITLHYNDLIYRSEKKVYSKAVDTALRYMKQRLYMKCMVQEVAAFVTLEPHYFTTLFKQEVGISPSRYLMEQKIKEAKRLLRFPGNTVTYVATVLGFSDSSHFSKTFHKLTGISPREYMNGSN